MSDNTFSGTQLFALPPEILQDIWQQLDKRSLKRLRCTSKVCCRLSEPQLFENFPIYPHIRSFERLINLSRAPSLARHVRSINFNAAFLDVTNKILAKLASVSSAQITATESSEVLEHANLLHKQRMRPDLPVDELAMVSYLGCALPAFTSLRCFDVDDAYEPNASLDLPLPHIYEQMIRETCGRHKHTRLEHMVYGNPHAGAGAYTRPILLALHTLRTPLEHLMLRRINWLQVFQKGDFEKHTVLFQGIFDNLKYFCVRQQIGGSPGPNTMKQIQTLLSKMTKLEQLRLEFRVIALDCPNQKPRDERGCRLTSYFSSPPQDEIGPASLYGRIQRTVAPARLSWSSTLRVLSITGLVCTAEEMKSTLFHCSKTLMELEIGCLVLLPEEVTGPRACIGTLIRWMQNNLRLQKVSFSGMLTNGGMQLWYKEGLDEEDTEDSLAKKVYQYVLHGGPCPLDHVLVPSGYYDVEKPSYMTHLPDSLKPDILGAEAFYGDKSWIMQYESEDDVSDDSEDDGLHDHWHYESDGTEEESDLDGEFGVDNDEDITDEEYGIPFAF